MIETERLHLRCFTEADRDAVARWNADPEFTRHLAGVQSREQSDEAFDRWSRHWEEHGFGLLGSATSGSSSTVSGPNVPARCPTGR